MSDLIERTKEIAFSVNDRVVSARILEAVNGLEAQQAEIERLREALGAVVRRSNNDSIGTAKVIDMREIALTALEQKP